MSNTDFDFDFVQWKEIEMSICICINILNQNSLMEHYLMCIILPLWIPLIISTISLSLLVFSSIVSLVSSIYFSLSTTSVSTSVTGRYRNNCQNNWWIHSQRQYSIGICNLVQYWATDPYRFGLNVMKQTRWRHCHSALTGAQVGHWSQRWPETLNRELDEWQNKERLRDLQ